MSASAAGRGEDLAPRPGGLGRRLRVAHFTNSLERGGAEEHILGLLRALEEARCQQWLICPPALARTMRPNLPAGAALFPLRLRGWRDWRGAIRLARWLRRERIDILHCHQFFASLFGTPVARLGGVAVVVETPHLREFWRRGLKAHYAIDRCIARGVDGYIAVSAANADYLRRVKRLPPRKLHVIRNGIELAAFAPSAAGARRAAARRAELGLAPGDPMVLVPGRLEAQKGHAVLLAALPELRRKFPRLQAVFAGAGSQGPALERQAAAIGLAGAVRFAGFQRDMPAWLLAADVVVLPSWYEGLPLAAVEALAAARPLVATAVDGTVEVVRHGHTGLLVPPGNAGALGDAIAQMLEETELAHRLAAEGLEWAGQFDIRRQAAATGALYAELWRHSRRGRKEAR